MSEYRDNSSKNIGIRIGEIRDSLGLTLEDFGRLVEPIASKSDVSKWEKGMSKPNRKRIGKIAELGNMSVEELLGTNSMFDNPILTGRRIRVIRKELGLTMTEFGNKLGLTEKSGHVSNCETGKNLPNNERLKKIAELGNISVGELLGNNESKTVDEIVNEIKESFNAEEIKRFII